MIEWISTEDKTPYIGQYCIVKDAEGQAFAVWTGKQGFVLVDEKRVKDPKFWRGVSVKGTFVDISGARGELEFVPKCVVDEDGKTWNG